MDKICLNSSMRLPYLSPLFVSLLLALLFLPRNLAMAEEPFFYPELDPIVVTGTRIPEHLSKIGQSVTIITREDIESSPFDNIGDLLETVTGVDVRRRGAHGVQSDITIRGGSFEQTLILVDGINVSDAQSGHHNADLPVNLEDVERIEVLKGPGARVYGHNAMAGVINIVTREPERLQPGGYAKYGDYDYYDLGVHGVFETAKMSNRVTASRRSSTGYIANEETDFDIDTLAYKAWIGKGDQALTFSVGYTDKNFGAYRFYSDRFPDQREQTKALLAHSSADLTVGGLQVMPKAFWRHHDDDFKIDIAGNWFSNQHKTDAYGMQLSSRLKSDVGATAVGGEMTFETLESSNLGDHHRRRCGVFFEHRFYPAKWLTFGLGTSAMYYCDWGWQYWPGAEFNIELSKGINWFASAGRSFRIPTYTEMFYQTPANEGNPDLDPEQAWTYETGIRWHEKGLSGNCSTFWRNEDDVIDWSRVSLQDPWKARNIAKIETRGLELGLDFYPETFFGTGLVTAVDLAYTYLDSDMNTGGFDSKYVLDHLRHQVHGCVTLNWFSRVRHSVQARYEERMVGDTHVLVDTRLGCVWDNYEFFIEVTNLLDEEYMESGFVPAPGRWVIVGVKF